MPPKTKAAVRKADSKPTNGAVQKRSTRGKQTKPAETKKNVETTKKGKAAKEQKVEEEKEEDVKEQSADEDAADEEVMTEEQEEALRKEILGDMASDDDESDSDNDDQEASTDAFKSSEDVVSLDPEQVKKSKEETKAEFDKKKKAPVKTVSNALFGVIYLGRIPHGFYEDEMKGYFSQFGKVTRLRLARNKHGQSKHYGFIEFQSAQVAEIVAETMDNYLLLGHLLQCKVLPKESVHENLFKFSSRRFRKANASLIQQKKHNQKRSLDKHQKRIANLVKAENERRKKIKDLGIDYDFPGYVSLPSLS
ncbi:hypothetical protein BDB00DRAFT_755771 [Zychaea mexicana]|uniref:uncharacterized protein n=1 Tax=Zychaea mexicana TaxID=64656 RepID=UPI0022FF3CC9|nr:uncharacterized protein BDB00DRAFT_755771 [Zychaea mexicana]KAI9497834.1 hypothetical protein BDB00DRAFT_755771 [Zychaea mexicana]